LDGKNGSLLVQLKAQNNAIFNMVRLDGWKITQMICEKFFESWKRAGLFHGEPFVFPSPSPI
jgi:hypothetical protein